MNNFTPRAQQALALARRESDRLDHKHVGAEHLLLGLVKLNQGVGCSVLLKTLKRSFEPDTDILEALRVRIEEQISKGNPTEPLIGNIPYTPRLKKILALAEQEAEALNHSYVGTEHLLIGMIREGEGQPAVILKELGLSLKIIRESVMEELDPNYTSSTRIENEVRTLLEKAHGLCMEHGLSFHSFLKIRVQTS